LAIPFIWTEMPNSALNRALSQTIATLQLSVFRLNVKFKQKQRPPSGMNKSIIDPNLSEKFNPKTSLGFQAASPMHSLNMQPAGERWELLSRELQQKQDLIHRLMKENDEKTDALKLTGAEIIDLRRQIKLMQSENSVLRKRLHEEEEIDISAVVNKEVERMNNEELKLKIIKIAQMYRNERGRNEEFSKTIKQAQDEVSEAYKYKTELDRLREKHEKEMHRMQKIQTQIDKVKVYRDTIKKQETVISKLEKILERTLKDTQAARESAQELEKLKTENLELQRRIKESAYGSKDMSEQSKQEIRRLERLVQELNEQLRSKRPDTRGSGVSNAGPVGDEERMRLEVDLQKAELRMQAMQDEMNRNASRFAKEISYYKGLIAEKQSVIDTMTAGID